MISESLLGQFEELLQKFDGRVHAKWIGILVHENDLTEKVIDEECTFLVQVLVLYYCQEKFMLIKDLKLWYFLTAFGDFTTHEPFKDILFQICVHVDEVVHELRFQLLAKELLQDVQDAVLQFEIGVRRFVW